MNKFLAFFLKDLRTEMTYPFAFLGYFLNVLVTTLPFFFIGLLVDPGSGNLFKQYGTDFFGFVLIGIIFTLFLGPSLKGFSNNIRKYLVEGTFESMFVTPTKTTTILIASNLWNFTLEIFNATLLLLMGIFIFNINIFLSNIFTALIFLLLIIIAYSSIGLIGASFTILYKKGNTVIYLVSGASALFSGTFFPVEVLPEYLKLFSSLLPLTYGLKGIRFALLKNEPIFSLLPELTAMILFAVILVPVSLLILKFTIKKAKMDGSLSNF